MFYCKSVLFTGKVWQHCCKNTEIFLQCSPLVAEWISIQPAIRFAWVLFHQLYSPAFPLLRNFSSDFQESGHIWGQIKEQTLGNIIKIPKLGNFLRFFSRSLQIPTNLRKNSLKVETLIQS